MEENRCLEEQTHRHSRKQYRKMPQCRQMQGQTCRWRLPSQNTAGKGVLALADVKIGDFMTIRNVRIKEDDYGLTVAMPKTKTGANEQYKDAVFFADRGIKENLTRRYRKRMKLLCTSRRIWTRNRRRQRSWNRKKAA